MGQRLIEILDYLELWRPGSFKTPSNPAGVLLVSSGGIGDTLLFRLMVARFQTLLRKGETLHLVVRSASAQAAFLFGEGITVHAYDYPKFLKDRSYRRSVCWELQSLGVRVAGSTDHLRHPLIDDVMVRATSAPEKFALNPRSWPKYDRLLHRYSKQYHSLIMVPEKIEHRLVRWWRLANGVTGENLLLPKVRLSPDVLPPPNKSDHPRTMLHPFSVIRERQHSVKTFQTVLNALPVDMEVLLSAGPGDIDRNPEFLKLLDDPRVRIDESSLEQKAATLQDVQLLVSVDTSIMHLGVLAGAPTICLATAAHVRDSVPYDDRTMPDNVIFLYHDMDCRMCLGNCILKLEDDRYPCITRLDLQLVLDAISSKGI